MWITNLEPLVKQFRTAIDTAFDRGEFRSISPFSRFPNGCCDLSCDLLGQFLLEHGVVTHQVNGTHKHDPEWHHVWLVTEDRQVIDITGDQFIGKLISEEDVSPVHIGTENIIHRHFCVNRFHEENTKFTDAREFTGFGGMPNPRQRTLIRIYEIISRNIRADANSPV